KVGTDFSRTFSSLTDALSKVKDESSADQAIPKLQEIDSKLEETRGALDNLSAQGKATLRSIFKVPLEGLRALVDKVLAFGVGDKLKPLAEQVLAKLADLLG